MRQTGQDRGRNRERKAWCAPRKGAATKSQDADGARGILVGNSYQTRACRSTAMAGTRETPTAAPTRPRELAAFADHVRENFRPIASGDGVFACGSYARCGYQVDANSLRACSNPHF